MLITPRRKNSCKGGTHDCSRPAASIMVSIKTKGDCNRPRGCVLSCLRRLYDGGVGEASGGKSMMGDVWYIVFALLCSCLVWFYVLVLYRAFCTR